MSSSFLPKYQPKITKISVLPSQNSQGRNLGNFWLAFSQGFQNKILLGWPNKTRAHEMRVNSTENNLIQKILASLGLPTLLCCGTTPLILKHQSYKNTSADFLHIILFFQFFCSVISNRGKTLLEAENSGRTSLCEEGQLMRSYTIIQGVPTQYDFWDLEKIVLCAIHTS